MNLKKYIYITIIVSIVFIFIIFILDIIDITRFIPITMEYDWLGFLGTYIGSLFGGLITLFGVYQTIEYERQKDLEQNILEKKPYFYVINPHSEYDYKNTTQFILSEDGSYKNKRKREQLAIIKNTDNAIMIVDFILINNVKYYPTMGNVIDKNQSIFFEIFYNDKIEFENIELHIEDTIGNAYAYEMVYSSDEKFIVELKEKSK